MALSPKSVSLMATPSQTSVPELKEGSPDAHGNRRRGQVNRPPPKTSNGLTSSGGRFFSSPVIALLFSASSVEIRSARFVDSFLG